jgi:hypothetical protein
MGLSGCGLRIAGRAVLRCNTEKAEGCKWRWRCTNKLTSLFILGSRVYEECVPHSQGQTRIMGSACRSFRRVLPLTMGYKLPINQQHKALRAPRYRSVTEGYEVLNDTARVVGLIRYLLRKYLFSRVSLFFIIS